MGGQKRRATVAHAPGVHQQIKRAKIELEKSKRIIALKHLQKLKKHNPEAFEPIIKEVPEGAAPRSAKEIPCKYHLKGSCQFGDACRYSHSTGATSGADASRLQPRLQDELLVSGVTPAATTQHDASSVTPAANGPAKDRSTAPQKRTAAAPGKARKKPLSQLEREKLKADAELRAKDDLRKEKEAELVAKRKKVEQSEKIRHAQKKKMFKRNKKGQPLMKYRVESVLEKLQS